MPSPMPSLSDIDLRQLRVFRSVVECHGFAAAQHTLGLSRSTISAQMSALETRLGMTLCRRGRSGFSLTEQGRKIYDETVKFFAALENFRTEIGTLRGRLVGEIAVGIVDALVENEHCRLGEAIAEFGAQVPDVHLTLLVISPNQIENALLTRQISVALMPNLPMDPLVHLQRLFDEEQYLYCGARHPLFAAKEKDLTLDRIAGLAYARRGYAVATPYHSIFSQPPSATAFDMEGLAHLILSGRYISFLPKHYVAPWVERNEMRVLRPGAYSYKVGICAAHMPENLLTRVGRIFRDCLVDKHRHGMA